MKRTLFWLAMVLLLGWIGYQLHIWLDCKARGGEWLRAPLSSYECRGAR